MKHALMVAAVVLLAGCAEFQAVKSGVGFYGAQASDETLDSAIWTICKASPVGAIGRRFNTPQLAQSWAMMCMPQP